MESQDRKAPLVLAALAGLGLALLIGIWALSRSGRTATSLPPTASAQPLQNPATATGVWQALLERTPLAQAAPLPDPIPGPFDGTYAKVDQSWPQWWLCLRCADYRPAGGIWRLQFDRGIMRIYYDVTGWTSLASYTASGDRLSLFNDPYCPDETGKYVWQVEGDQLRLRAVADACAFELRGQNLAGQPWSACSPAGVADPQQKPPGCEDSPVVPAVTPPPHLSVAVAVYGGDSRFFETPPDVVAVANSADRPAPEGIDIAYHGDSIGYGLNRILWWNGDWIEASTDLPFAAMGVQFLGAPPIGWARVLFDGVEAWRGDTSAIWSDHNRFGGYVEVSGFDPGRHTLRVESLGFDYHPVEVASFGFSYLEGVER